LAISLEVGQHDGALEGEGALRLVADLQDENVVSPAAQEA
jgi:hypothetical protein